MLKFLTTYDYSLIEEDKLKAVSQGVLFSAKDLKSILKTQNEYKSYIKELE